MDSIETKMKIRYKNATNAFEVAQADYLTEMRERYIEEQMFSDRIKSASTWWTWGLISTHFLLFMLIQFYVEPRKKQDLKDQMISIMTSAAEQDRANIVQTIESLLAKHEPIDLNVVELKPELPVWTVSFFVKLLVDLFRNAKFLTGFLTGAVLSGCLISAS